MISSNVNCSQHVFAEFVFHLALSNRHSLKMSIVYTSSYVKKGQNITIRSKNGYSIEIKRSDHDVFLE
jgi:hypothetical protein